ncbi:ATP-binding cassette domain-containing protein [Streptococcus loxodontisalivarius]|uniref:Osmoprotectant transport system ATP-binding protein n=1 Tax=Streptococcus loxodontisalivarius TaxID=1349415 RepID=A0ABS2PUP0_9STRE|nr:ABC transporter ATP-binding protein [Streptococcus loxodontisalivarius]MBM7643646.1 osmoprotectant transport system ATP-binding protein [Streptococcus loxodontisalivarius]
MIEFKEVSKSYADKLVLEASSFKIEDGEILVLVGPSGSGKTTLLKMINRLIEPSRGQILLDGQAQESLAKRDMRLEMGYVLQQIALFPNLTVGQNIELIPGMKKWDKARKSQEARRLLNRIGLDDKVYYDRLPSQLSGGEQQRVGILRAIIAQPKILLMDEPFSALDPISKTQLQDLTLELQQEFGMTTVFVTHDIKEALKMGNRIAVLHEGRIAQLASPEEIVSQPANDFVKELFGGVEHG